MNVSQRNSKLFSGLHDDPGVFPHLDRLDRQRYTFEVDFGLRALPEEPGVLLVRGARQFGKSTWLEACARETAERFGPGSAALLNGDELADADALQSAIEALLPFLSTSSPVRRLFIDEISAVADWEQALKRLIDADRLRDVLVVTTGSSASDLRRGAERLPGRKGRLARTQYLFTPVSFDAFLRATGRPADDDAVALYLLSGGSPMALTELAATGRLPEFVIETVRDWVLGEVVRSGRGRASLLAVMHALDARGGSPLGQAKLAREAGLANNTVAAGYIEQLADVLALGLSYPWDVDRGVQITRRPAKYPFINLLVAVTFSRDRLRSVDDWRALAPERQGVWLEWLVAQELWRRRAIAGVGAPELLPYWSSRRHELDFVVASGQPGSTDVDFVEVKRGRAGPLDFGWFPRMHHGRTLTVVCDAPFETPVVRGVDIAAFLLGDDAVAGSGG